MLALLFDAMGIASKGRGAEDTKTESTSKSTRREVHPTWRENKYTRRSINQHSLQHNRAASASVSATASHSNPSSRCCPLEELAGCC